jgi:hypothetical protein
MRYIGTFNMDQVKTFLSENAKDTVDFEMCTGNLYITHNRKRLPINIGDIIVKISNDNFVVYSEQEFLETYEITTIDKWKYTRGEVKKKQKRVLLNF